MTDRMRTGCYPGGVTVAMLKAMIADWPEYDENGDPTEVWIETVPGCSSQVREVDQLNARRREDGSRVADLYLGVAK